MITRAVVKTIGCSGDSLVREAIVERLSEFEDLQVAEQRLRNHRTGQWRTCAPEEVARELGLADLADEGAAEDLQDRQEEA